MEAAQLSEQPLMTEAEYLAFADTQESKFEFRNGRIYAMTGGSVRHAFITANMITHLNNLIAEHDCIASSPDLRVHHASMRTYRYPDVTVICGDPIYKEGSTDTIINPVLLVEVLSPESAVRDYNEKLEEYTSMETLQGYVLVSQDKAKVEIFRRNEVGEWVYEFATGLENEIEVLLMGERLRLSLAQIYRRVKFEAEQKSDVG